MKILLPITLAALAFIPRADAVNVSLHSSNSGITGLNVNIVGSTITIEETWGSSGFGVLEFSGLEGILSNNGPTAYTVQKIVHNQTGADWTRLAIELLDPVGQPEDAGDIPPPAFVPAGFSTSNDNDGLSFAEGDGIARTSDVFPGLIDDTDTTRDFLEFYNGTLANGGTATFSFGLRELFDTQQPFLLFQRPNVTSNVPDGGGTMLLLTAGVATLGFLRRK